MQTGTATVEDSMAFPQKKKKMELLYDPDIPLLGIYLKNPEIPVQKLMHPTVHSSTIYNSQVLEAAQVAISR